MTTTDNAIVLYQSTNGAASLEVHLDHETVWLSQKQMAELFQRERSVITKHLRNVFSEGELDEKSNVQNMHFAFSDKPVTLYNLDVIISVGYRVKSQQGTRFR
ncbi:MAG: RhuM family protein, partial [Pseudomonadota bacterium]